MSSDRFRRRPREDQRCENCDAFRYTDTRTTPVQRVGSLTTEIRPIRFGTCRAKSPVPFPIMLQLGSGAVLDPSGKQPQVAQGTQGVWPPTNEHEWCRDWQEQPPPQGDRHGIPAPKLERTA